MMSDNAALRPDIAACVFPDETLLWQGQPQAGLRFLRHDIRNGIVWAVIAGCLFWVSLKVGHSTQLLLAALAFGVFAAYLGIGRAVLRRAGLARTAYAITDKRALSLQSGPFGVRRQQNIQISPDTRAEIDGEQGDRLSFWLHSENPEPHYDGRGLQFLQLQSAQQVLHAFEQAALQTD
ncbi:MAG: hypothetical protein CSA68_02285 [Rhodobacterales bacterium]|nr:MAG: hypothetical protein CSA68_02285 [Rhodobacterales bacterium]